MVRAENSFTQLSCVEQEFCPCSAALLAAEHGPGIGASNGVGALGSGLFGPACDAGCGARSRARVTGATAPRTCEDTEQGQRAPTAREAWGSHAACGALSV